MLRRTISQPIWSAHAAQPTARDLSLTDKSLARVFDSVLSAGLVPPGTAYDRARFVDDSCLADSRK
jgi:hypothetical protein